MSTARSRAEVPPLVTSLVGVVVALVSGVFGISAHGLAAGTGGMLPSSEQVLLVVGACAAVGAVTAALARHRSPGAVSAAGLLVGQGLVHLSLCAGHDHSGTGHVHGATDAAAVRAAMDSAAVADRLWTPVMLGAHLAAVLLTLAVVAVLAATLAWVAARVRPLPGKVRLVVVPRLEAPRTLLGAPDAGYLLARGGTRAPPAGV